ncbi:predicted protein [Uncinocarpus reesii 1704]|uniref:Uncharacterized protein n=1 Tax=Uncinocarpus reesii (strain UAMH 1704) TaxID=336963 RepID=C4JTX7_UNCRE|nr:uncharacterized protein UREG_05916 [Uncinocarpus reesii 1704]EEP81074.1 predicted protein [Uncinocarpus reesii 1704]
MPTPSVSSPRLTPLSLDALSARGTCPPEIADRTDGWPASADQLAHDVYHNAHLITASQVQSELGTVGPLRNASTTIDPSQITENKDIKVDDAIAPEILSPATSVSTNSTEIKDEPPLSPARPSTSPTPSYMTSLSHEFSNVRLLPDHPSSFLRAGSKFVGTQKSESNCYNVDVEIKDVNMEESFLCGYLRIQELTHDHPTLTTYFEGEIIGTKHTFQTKNKSWGATDKTDMHYWARFPAWRPLAKVAKKPDFTEKNFAQKEHIFMRWKEYFPGARSSCQDH